MAAAIGRDVYDRNMVATPWFALLLVAFPPATRPAERASLELLAKSEQFAGDAVGIAGVTSEQVIALRKLASGPEPAGAFRALAFAAPSAAGKLYGLIGCKRFFPEGYAEARKQLLDGPDEPVQVFQACIISNRSLHELIANVDRGDYDRWLVDPATRPAD
jgi:hypothetical protein